ncbi:MAG: chemotaxis protein CheW [Gammaproteobacteria bacterium]|nr:chemotaxis protein CheW [Gammaproteobacteria bacterium]
MSDTIQCMLLSMYEQQLLLPASVVVDIINGRELDIVVDAQGGLIGKVQWRGWTVPLLSFEAAVGDTIPKFNMQTKAIVLHALSEDDEELLPYIALTAQKDPTPLVLGEAQLKVVDYGEHSSHGLVNMNIQINGDIIAAIPNFEALMTYTHRYWQ